MHRRSLLAALAALPAAPALAQPRPTRLLVPFPAGGGVDGFARLFAPVLAASLGGPVVIENIGGASSRLGLQAMLRAPADGGTLLVTNDTLAAIEALPVPGAGPFLPHLAPLLLAASAPQILVARPGAGLDGLAAFGARLRGPRPPLVGVPGIGSSQHLVSELIGQALGGRPEHVPYRGGGQIVTDLLAGQVEAGVLTLGMGLDQVRDGRLLGLAVTGAARVAVLPAVPAMAETVPGLALDTWMGVLAPAGTPPATLAALHAAALAALRQPAVEARLAAQGFEAPGLGPDAFGAVLRDTARRFAGVVQQVGLRGGEA